MEPRQPLGQPVHGLRVLGDALVAHAQRLPAAGHRDEGKGLRWEEPLPQGEFLDFVVRSSDASCSPSSC